GIERQVWIVVAIATCAIAPSKCGDLGRIVDEAAALTFLMDQGGVGTDHATITPINEPVAIVDVTIGDCKLVFVEATLLKKQCAWRQQTGRRHARAFPG